MLADDSFYNVIKDNTNEARLLKDASVGIKDKTLALLNTIQKEINTLNTVTTNVNLFAGLTEELIQTIPKLNASINLNNINTLITSHPNCQALTIIKEIIENKVVKKMPSYLTKIWQSSVSAINPDVTIEITDSCKQFDSELYSSAVISKNSVFVDV